MAGGCGGGWGDPLDREPQAVSSDARNEKVSAEQARVQYNVVLRNDGTPDEQQTPKLRAQMRAGEQEDAA